MTKKIVILGAGYAGILTAKKIAKRLKSPKEFDITIIDRNPFHTMLTELHEVAAGRVEEDSIKIDLKRVFAGRNVNVVMDTITTVDYEKKTVVCERGSYDYDYAVLATGSKPAFFSIPGAEENALTLWSYDDAVKIKEHILNMFRLAARETDVQRKRKLLTFLIIGGGFTGVEMTGELAELVPVLCDRFEIDRSLVRVIEVDMLSRVCTVLPPKLSEKTQKRLEKMGVELMLDTSVLSVGQDSADVRRGEISQTIDAGTIIWTAGIEGSDLAQASTALGPAGRGRIQTDEYLRAINNESVYVGGDNIFFIPEGQAQPVPQMVENCEACADVIAHNLICDINGGAKKKYNPAFHGVMVSIGGRYGVANVGMPNKLVALPSFFAMFSKHFINIVYFIQVLGWNKIFSYIRHEFLTIRNRRSFVGGHFSNRSASFFLVPLRVYLGGYWLYEGIKKVKEGWLGAPKLESFFNGANSFYESILNPGAAAVSGVSAATGAAETVSAATGVAETGGAIIDWNILGLVRVIFVNAGEYALKIQVSLVDWIINTLVLPGDTMQMVFQISIVLLEILIGMALMAGLFTTLSGFVSLLLQSMFLTSTGLYMSSWWMIFAGIAMLFGAGTVLSLDYYVMPVLKRYWKDIRFVKKWYLYND